MTCHTPDCRNIAEWTDYLGDAYCDEHARKCDGCEVSYALDPEYERAPGYCRTCAGKCWGCEGTAAGKNSDGDPICGTCAEETT